MNSELSSTDRDRLAAGSADARQEYLLAQAAAQGAVWILCDDDGFVMMQSEDERCVPVWPDEAFAQAWATGEWVACRPLEIDLESWHDRWTEGLQKDGIQVALFPSETDDVVVLSPPAFAESLPA